MKRVNNNIKFYTFIDILKNYSDKNVSLSIKEIQHHMKKRLGVNIDRRTIYGYIKDMKDLGIDVSDYDKNKEGYYLNSNCFEDYEVRILTDAILTSNFVTEKKTIELIKKLKSFNSIYQNRDFLKNTYIEDIPKSNNEEIFVNIAKIDEAIKLGKKIKFNYCNYDYYKNLVYRVDKEGKRKEYIKSPVYMILRNKNYYLVCADENSKSFQNFRVDRILNTSVLFNENITDLNKFEDCRNGLNPMEYLRKNFKMFSGKSNITIVEFNKNLLNYMLDEFGDYIYIMEKNDHSKNNLSIGKDDLFEIVDGDSLTSMILKKILGKKDYKMYVLSGKYMEDGMQREIIDDFRKILNDFVDKGQKWVEKNNDFMYRNRCNTENSENYKTVDSCTENKKVYIGIFVAKESVGLAKWLMQFGSDIKVIWPDSLRNLIIDEIEKMRKFYSEDD